MCRLDDTDTTSCNVSEPNVESLEFLAQNEENTIRILWVKTCLGDEFWVKAESNSGLKKVREKIPRKLKTKTFF